MATFETVYTDQLEPLLADPARFPEALALLEQALNTMDTRVDRSHVNHWMGTIHQALAARALSEDRKPAARDHFTATEECFLKAIEEAPQRVDSRLSLARYYLSMGGDATAALEVLYPEETLIFGSDERMEAFYEHQLYTLRGVAHAFRGQFDRSAESLDAAFSDRLLPRLTFAGLDLGAIRYLVRSGAPFESGVLDALVAQVRKHNLVDDEGAARLREGLG